MGPDTAALVLCLIYLAVAFGLRAWLLYRLTGTTGYRGLSGPAGSIRWWGGVLLVVALAAGLVAPALQLTGLIAPITVLNVGGVHITGAVLALLGMLATLIAQRAMRQAWRIGVDTSETTELIQTGVFAMVRNPVFTALLVTAAGLALLAPNVVALSALVMLLVAVELQVRTVEEPYLFATHGESYQDYARGVGRFLPGIGKHRPR